MPRSTRLEDKYINTTSGLTATNYQGAIDELKVLIDNVAGNLGSVYTQNTITADRVISIAELGQEEEVNQYFISPNITLTPPTGFTINSYEPVVNNYFAPTSNTFISDNLKSSIYNIFYRGTNIFIYNVLPYSTTSFRLTNNNAGDLAVNYNTTSWLPINLSQIGSLVRVSNRFTFTATNTTFTPGYTGFFKSSHVIIMRSGSARVHLAGRLVNTTTGNVEIVSDFSYIRSINDANLYAMQSPSITIPCTQGDNFELQFIREGSSTGSTTIDSTYASQLFVESIVL